MTISQTLLAIAFSAIALAGCADETAATTPATTADEAARDHNKADILFVQNMIHHHEQAVEMSMSMLEKMDIDPKVMARAIQIKDAQRAEVDQLTIWLQVWGESEIRDAGSEPGHFARRHDMRHVDDETRATQMANLRAAPGSDASQMFLTHMVAHHEEAVAMAQEEIANGENPEAIAFARALITAQEAEIKAMQGLLAAPPQATLAH